MKPIQVLFDEALLRRLDDNAEVKRDGRSAVLRRAAAEYLRKGRSLETAEAYRRAYAPGDPIEREFTGWAYQGAWPEK